MSIQLKPGVRLRSATDTTEVVVVRAPSDPIDLRIGGHAALAIDAEPAELLAIEADFEQGTLLGKRYSQEDLALELLCTKGGPASLSVGSDLLEIKSAKALPSSD